LQELDDATRMRTGGRAALAEALADARRHTLQTFACHERALGPTLAVPYRAEINPPRWELGHVGWFQDWWLSRNPDGARGVRARPDAPRAPPRLRDADAWFDSGRVPHRDRWSLPLPSADALRADLALGLEQTLAQLAGAEESDAGLYMFRLALFHEDMHHEASLYTAQHLGIGLEGWAPRPSRASGTIRLPGGVHATGWRGPGFAFDNELETHALEVPAFEIDAAPVTWARYLAFVAAGGYRERRHWTEAGWSWLGAQGLQAPRDLRAHGSRWQRRAFERWIDLDPELPAMHLTAHEAEAWCEWAGRRLPGEAEWERAACEAGARFAWGQVWEWTASAFVPYPGFVAHPYRDYSQPWFHTRRTLRGGSFATHSRMKHPRYRNFFPPERNDLFAGFRSCVRKT
jgi:ergothioneine biosynthesis protein EgtB